MRFTLPALAALACSAPALAASVDWASKPADSSVSTSAAVLGQADGVATSIPFYAAAHVRDFKPGKVSAAQIEKALKLPVGELGKWDLIAFESRAPSPGQAFASSLWNVSDLNLITSAAYDGVSQTAVPGTGEGWRFRSGTIDAVTFKGLFGSQRSYGPFNWILIKLPPVIDKRSDRIAVWLSGRLDKGDVGPAPDAIGVIR